MFLVTIIWVYYVNIHPVLKKTIILISVIFMLVLAAGQLASAANTSGVATIHGAVYEWDSFEPLENVIVEVNSTPPQSMLAKYGLYSFDLVPGDYTISARYYNGNDLIAYTEEGITITDDGDYVMDLILLPVYYDDAFNESEFAELDEIASFSDEEGTPFTYVMVILLILVVASSGAYYFFKRRSSATSEISGDTLLQDDTLDVELDEDRWADLPDDLRQVVAIVAKNDGRITQKDLRTKVRHSEAKVSLMVSDLESRGIVRKFKKGRGNVIILEDIVDADDPNQNI